MSSPFFLVSMLAWASLLVGASGTALVRSSLRPARRESDSAADPVTVLLVRPVSGADPWLEGALASLPAGLDPAYLRIRIAVADRNDAACPIAERAVASLVAAGFSATLCLTAATGQNRKAAQIAAVLAAEPAPRDATREIVIVADADVDLAASPLRALTEPFDDAAVAAVWAPPVERAPALGLGDRASQALLGGSLHAFPLLAKLDEGGLVGKLCALRRSSLDAVGGFDALVPWLGEDMRLAALFRARGLRLVATDRPAISVANGRTSEAVLLRYARWLAVIRAQRPWLLLGYPALFFGTFPAVALCVTLAGNEHARWPLVVAAAILLARLAVAHAAARAAGRAGSFWESLVDSSLADALLAWAFVLATTQRRVAWKAHRFTFDRRGMLREAEEVPRAVA